LSATARCKFLSRGLPANSGNSAGEFGKLYPEILAEKIGARLLQRPHDVFRLRIHVGETPLPVEHDKGVADTFEDVGDAFIGIAQFALRTLPGKENGLGVLQSHGTQ